MLTFATKNLKHSTVTVLPGLRLQAGALANGPKEDAASSSPFVTASAPGHVLGRRNQRLFA